MQGPAIDAGPFFGHAAVKLPRYPCLAIPPFPDNMEALMQSRGIFVRILPLTLALLLLQTALAQVSNADSGSPKDDAKSESRPDAKRATTLDRITVTGGKQSDIDQRRNSTTAMIIVGREEIEQFGDSTVADVLKRLPGVSIGGRAGRGGEIRMRGLGSGYTQILVNGERIPPGFSVDSISPEQVERIEVMRAPTAEFGARAIAGTINIVLRQALKKMSNEVRIAASLEHNRLQPNVALTRNDALPGGGAYNLSVSMFHNNQVDASYAHTDISNLTTGASIKDQLEITHSTNQREGLHFSSRLQWSLRAGDSISIQPFLLASRGHSSSLSQLKQDIGTDAVPYASSQSRSESSTSIGRLNTVWNQKLSDSTRLQLSVSVGESRFINHSLRDEFDPQADPLRSLLSRSDTEDRSWNLKTKLSHALMAGHSLVIGAEADEARREQTKFTLENGVLQPGLESVGENLQASTRLLAAYAQDEWEPSTQVSAYAGLRLEAINTRSSAGNSSTDNRSSVLTPLLHAVWKPDPASRNQFRTSLTRSYKSPNLGQLSGLPSLSLKANDASNPDSVGNPGLRPELATGVELAYEWYQGSLTMFSANLFYRRIHDLMRTVTSQQAVPWSVAPRWVSRPENIGAASTQGIELEARTRLNELVADAAPVNLRANASIFNSRVSGIPGPDNRLDGQPRGTANIGADGRLRRSPLTLGASLAWTPVTHIQSSSTEDRTNSMKFEADAYALWMFSLQSQLRLTLSNALPHDSNSASHVMVPNQQQRFTSESRNPTRTSVALRWELKL
jgi:iron complex outermembrane receptor protein